MAAATTNGKPELAEDMSFNMDMRNKVEAAFQKQVQSENGCAARDKFAQMLEKLGLTQDEAVLLLNECDPMWKNSLPYTDFLDFIFGKAEASDPKEKAVATPKVATTDEVAKSKVQKEALKDVLKKVPDPEEPASDRIKQAIGISDNSARQGEKAGDRSQDISNRVTSKDFEDHPSDKGTAEQPAQSDENSQGKVFSEDCEAADEGTTEKPPDSDEKDSIKTEPVEAELKQCHDCREYHVEVFQDDQDDYFYCEKCWTSYYNSQPKKLVDVVKGPMWAEDKLIAAWQSHPIPGWGYRPFPSKPVTAATGDPTNIGEHFFPVHVRLNPGLVGTHARSCTRNADRNLVGEVLCGRYRIEEMVGAGHFTRALLAVDQQTGKKVCVKKHNSLTVELLTDLLTICRRLKSEDKDSKYFPELFDAFYDIEGFTVESIVEGKNCLHVMREDKQHFRKFENLQIVAEQGYNGLVYMQKAGVLHCDLKPDNIMWVKPKEEGEPPQVILVDFGCSRLDSRLENGRNWALSECGAGHVGKWAPEMVLRLPITHKADVWGLAVALLELHCGRTTWCGEADTVEVILAQVLGIVNARNGLPEHLLKQSPLDIRQLYTPHPSYFPVQRFGTFGRGARFQELRPATWGLGCVLGNEERWDEQRIVFANFILKAMNLDHAKRPTADDMVQHPFMYYFSDFREDYEDVIAKMVVDFKAAPKTAAEDVSIAATPEPKKQKEDPWTV